MKISQRGLETQESPIRKLKPYADDAVKRGIHIYHLNIGQPDIPTPKPVWDAIKSCDDEVISYGPAQGYLELRQAIADYFSRFNISLKPDNHPVRQDNLPLPRLMVPVCRICLQTSPLHQSS